MHKNAVIFNILNHKSCDSGFHTYTYGILRTHAGTLLWKYEVGIEDLGRVAPALQWSRKPLKVFGLEG